jgi:hypothetical protein
LAYYYVDESGHANQWVFAIIRIDDYKDAELIVKKWRNYMKRLIKGFKANEYKDSNASKRERKKILNEIANKKIYFWAIINTNYVSHKNNYVRSLVKLLQHCDISEKDIIIAVDQVQCPKHMDKHIRKIKKDLAMPDLNITWLNSEQEKGIQVTDALAGTVCRHFVRRDEYSFFEIVEHLLQKEVIKI